MRTLDWVLVGVSCMAVAALLAWERAHALPQEPPDGVTMSLSADEVM